MSQCSIAASERWRFEPGRSDSQPEFTVRSSAAAAAGDAHDPGERAARSGADLVALPPVVTDARPSSRQPKVLQRQRSSNGRDGHCACTDGGARLPGP
jgi:hypothetical protein